MQTEKSASRQFAIYKMGGKVLEAGIPGIGRAKDSLDLLVEIHDELGFGVPGSAGLYYAAEVGGDRDLVWSFRAQTAILQNAANLISREKFAPMRDAAIRWANTERGEYGADWMVRNLPNYISLTNNVSAALAKQGMEEWAGQKAAWTDTDKNQPGLALDIDSPPSPGMRY